MTHNFCKRIFILLLLFCTKQAEAFQFPDSTMGSFISGINYHYGFIIAHRPSIVPLQQEHLKGIEISFSKATDGNKEWQKIYGYPTWGVKFNWFDLGNEERLGNGFAICPYLHFDVTHCKFANISVEYGFGIGYIQKVFNLDDNYKNVAIGSHLNGVFNLNLQSQWSITPTTTLSTALGITHFSNGSITTPNLGINLATVQIGIRQYWGKTKKTNNEPLSEFKKGFHNSINACFAVKQIYPPGDKLYGAWIISASRTKQFTRKSALGAGIDLFYDYSIIRKLEFDTSNNITYFSGFRPGINFTYELVQSDRFTFMVQMGFYPYTQLKSDGNLYHRVCIRYHFKNDYFACINLKSHFAKADFIEWGIGKRF